MAKYDLEFKLKIVIEYINGTGGFSVVGKRNGISRSMVRDWYRAYSAFGIEGLERKRSKNKYSLEDKIVILRWMKENNASLSITSTKFRINNPSLISSWVNAYNKHGIDGLSEKKKGSPSMKKKKINNGNSDYVKKIEHENELLRAELAYIKKLKASGISIPNRLLKSNQESLKSSEKNFKLNIVLEALKFPKSTYMYWQKQFDKENKDQKIENQIKEIFEENAMNYGYRRITGELRNRGYIINHKKVQRIMSKLNLKSISFTRKNRKYSSYKGKIGRIADNLVNRRFDTNIPYQKITTDTSEFKYHYLNENGLICTGKLYLDPFMDLFNREIISYSISKKPNAEGIMSALTKAVALTDACEFRRTFHSDQGWAYQMKKYRQKLKDNQIFQSMSRKGNCLDNSPMESFFSILKQEIFYGKVYESYEQLEAAIENYIWYYNNKRIKSKLEWKSPIGFRESRLNVKIA
ncbi:IS3 family transposase [Macrococcoides canis]|uniref:IS3 family transposase n=1 Tax=Macrococcoides canis TaxID=1855823 RepID=UPI0010FBD770|nr:IS3 family transposase [Macrococcus canis]QCT75132.1 IS3 family transposase [Macrococcus canis]QNR07146.1 IS3 family transposase [Macrococcus canis]QTQ08734.1 IS3 family transposase [Macrococcus canis]QTQ09134.1 IS3 family transposase [Macrococcus canis]